MKFDREKIDGLAKTMAELTEALLENDPTMNELMENMTNNLLYAHHTIQALRIVTDSSDPLAVAAIQLLQEYMMNVLIGGMTVISTLGVDLPESGTLVFDERKRIKDEEDFS